MPQRSADYYWTSGVSLDTLHLFLDTEAPRSPELRFNQRLFFFSPLYFFLPFYLRFDVVSIPKFVTKLFQIILEGVTGAKSIN